MHDDPQTALNPSAWRGKMSAKQIQAARAGYYGEISFIDTQVGRLMNWLQRHRSAELENTWFLFTSDHGDMQGDHNLWRKTYAYEGSTRIPFLVVPPAKQGKPKRARADEVVELRDVMPTLLEAAGCPVPGTVDGRSVVPLLKEPAREWRPYIHGEHCRCYSEAQEMQFVTDGRRNRLVHELEQRACGWVKDGRPFRPDKAPLVSPYRDVRWPGRARDGLRVGSPATVV